MKASPVLTLRSWRHRCLSVARARPRSISIRNQSQPQTLFIRDLMMKFLRGVSMTNEVDSFSAFTNFEGEKRFHHQKSRSLLFFLFGCFAGCFLMLLSLSLTFSLHFPSYTHNNMPIIMSSKRVVRRLRRPKFPTAASGKEEAHHFPLSLFLLSFFLNISHTHPMRNAKILYWKPLKEHCSSWNLKSYSLCYLRIYYVCVCVYIYRVVAFFLLLLCVCSTKSSVTERNVCVF